MLTQDDGFAVLLHRIKEGSEEAMLELVEKYGQHVFRAVRRKLNRKMRSKFDSGDFVQAMWASIFENRARLFEFTTARDLIVFLSRVAHNKVIDEIRRRLVLQGRNLKREVRLDQTNVGKSAVSRGPTASEVFIAGESLQQMTARHSTRSQIVFELRRNGATYAEIASVLGVTSKTVQRVLQRLRREVVS